MAVTTNNEQGISSKFARYGTGGAVAAGAVALIMYMRSEQGRSKLTSMFGEQFANIDDQLQGAIRENMPLIEESIDRVVEMLQQGVSSLSGEINRLADEAKQRIHQYAATLDEGSGARAEQVGSGTSS
jgi:ABC-type phosphate transport system auxiliary subunit